MRLVLLCLWLTGCTVTPLQQIKHNLDARFIYIDMHNHYVTATGDVPFAGNCVTYADAAKHQLQKQGFPATQWFVLTENHEPHMLTCSGRWCIDNRQTAVVEMTALHYDWLEVVP